MFKRQIHQKLPHYEDLMLMQDENFLHLAFNKKFSFGNRQFSGKYLQNIQKFNLNDLFTLNRATFCRLVYI
jgi:hypothetical protein